MLRAIQSNLREKGAGVVLNGGKVKDGESWLLKVNKPARHVFKQALMNIIANVRIIFSGASPG